ncbi:MAG: histidinol-phosphatase [Sphingomonas sp.]|uniref:inositol monophosphatase family protein n=1 Tax=Sphingomonas sp. TaxID=28214 RepID=UPI0017EF7885|nr:inositol monophosphatase family protein [Sphingomonas sp.]MBA3668303.1 histidinol-phosphatase [Sphingomonas sp.]
MDRISEFLGQLAQAARRVITQSRDEDFSYHNKATVGLDPVTQIDQDIETALRALISDAFPDDAIRGEEYGWTSEGARRTWSIDPIDGTRAFICGLPSWATLVGVIEDGDHVAGLIDLPVLGERLIATEGKTRRSGAPAAASGCRDLGSARLATTDPFLFEGPEIEAFDRIRRATLVARYGLDALAYARVATGDLDLVIESGLKRHDLDALVAVVRGAGGAIGDWDGGEDWDGGRIIAAASLPLYEEAVALLSA